MNEEEIPSVRSKMEFDQPNPPCRSVDILHGDVHDFRELQKANNILMAAYKELMTIAVKAKTWVSDTPALGSIDEMLEMFRAPPHDGCRVECSIQSAALPISPKTLISIMMDGERWASTFSHIVCRGSSEFTLGPSAVPGENIDAKLVHAEFRLPGAILPRWRTSFVRFKKMFVKNIWAIVDVSSDYITETNPDPTAITNYKRRPSGVIIRQRNFQAEVIWIENAEVQLFDVPGNINSLVSNLNFPFSAKYYIISLFRSLQRRLSKYVAITAFNDPTGLTNFITIADKLRRLYLDTVNSFPSERTRELLCNDKIKISKDTRANCTDGRHDYIASSTIHVLQSPTTIFSFLSVNNRTIEWTCMEPLGQLGLAAKVVVEGGCGCITLHVKENEKDEEAIEDCEFFLQDASANDCCSFIVSSSLAGPDVLDTFFFPTRCENRDILKPSGFAIMPAGPGGLQSETSLVTICIRRELDANDDDEAIEAMNLFMNDAIVKIISCRALSVSDDQDLEDDNNSVESRSD